MRALWLDARGNWDGAHDAAQADEGGAGDWVHAYLHRKEGDAGNAAYWYRRARKPVCKTSLDEEWAAIADALLKGEGLDRTTAVYFEAARSKNDVLPFALGGAMRGTLFARSPDRSPR